MTGHLRPLRADQSADAPDAPGVAFSAWDYGHGLARAGVAGKVGPGPCAVLHTLASHANKQAQAEVGMTCIARESGLSRRAVIKAVARLIQCRAIGRIRRRDEQTMVNETNLYTILPVEGIIAHPAPARRREQARSLARSRRRGSEHTVTTSERGTPSEHTVTRGSEHTVTRGSEHTVTRGSEHTVTTLVNTRAPKASPISIPLLSIPIEEPICAASAAPAPPSTQERAMADAIVPAPAQAALGGCAKSNGRQRKMTDEEKAQVQTALDRFNDRLRPIVDDEYGRFIREALSGIRGFGLEHYLSTINLMATAERFVGDPAVTPLTVTKTVPIWEDNGKPRTWRELQERKKRRMQNGRP